MRDGHAQKWTHVANGKTFDINHVEINVCVL